MSTFSLLTIVRGRPVHLNNLLRGVTLAESLPAEVIVIHMNQATDPTLTDPGVPLRQYMLKDKADLIPLAKARNMAASLATGDTFIFLDVDCIPHPELFGRLSKEVQRTSGVVMGNVHYLPKGSAEGRWNQEGLARAALPHPGRPEIDSEELRESTLYHLFWSLCFGIRRQEFERVGGFDTRYTGYGAEDTDFAFSLRTIGVPFYLSGAMAFHQYHPTCSPPYDRLEDIVRNAVTFHKKWRHWPMEGWLQAFADAGLIKWGTEGIQITRLPDRQLIDDSRNEAAYV